MSEERRSGAGAAAAMVLFALSGAALTGALLLFLTSVTPGRSDPHGYVMIFSALIGLVCTPVFLLALLLVFGRRPWVRLTVSIIVSFFTVGLGLYLRRHRRAGGRPGAVGPGDAVLGRTPEPHAPGAGVRVPADGRGARGVNSRASRFGTAPAEGRGAADGCCGHAAS